MRPNPTPPACPSCNGTVSEKFCPRCGETPKDPRDRGLWRFLLGWLDAVTSLDGRFLGSFRSLLLRPGELTESYLRGVRLRFLTPMQIVLFGNLIVFMTQPLVDAAVLNTPYASHLNGQIYSSRARELAREPFARSRLTEKEFAARFDRRADDASRTLVLLLVPLYALVLAAVRLPGRRGAVAHAAFAAEFVAFASTFFLGGLFVAFWTLKKFGLGAGESGAAVSAAKHVPALAVFGVAVWLVAAFRRLYGDRFLAAALRTVAALFLTIFPLTAYRFVLFLVALRTA